MAIERTPRYSNEKLFRFIDGQGRRYDWLAEQLGVDQSYVSKLKSGDRRVTEQIARELSKLIGIPLSEFTADNDPLEVAP